MVVRTLIAVALITAAGVYARALDATRVTSEREPDLSRIPVRFEAWRSREVPMSPEVEAVLGADTYLFRQYLRSDGASANLFVGYFADQDVGAQIHSPRNCLPGAGWSIQSITPVRISVPGGEQEAQHMVIQRQDRRQDVVYWFTTRSGTIVGEYALKWDLVKNSLARRPSDAAFVRFITADSGDPAFAELVDAVYPPLRAALAAAGLP